MRDQFDNFLSATYPELIDPERGGTSIGCYHGDGWFVIINTLCHNISEHQRWVKEQRDYAQRYNKMIDDAKLGNYEIAKELFSFCRTENSLLDRVEGATEEGYRKVPDEVPPVYIMQVKEKFGTLHFYYGGGDEYVRGLVSMAESLSAYTCEECGAPGRRRGGNWVKTLCDHHAREKDYHSDLEVEVGETVQIFTEQGYNQVSVLTAFENGELEVLDKNNATFKVKPLEIGGVEYGVYTPADA